MNKTILGCIGIIALMMLINIFATNVTLANSDKPVYSDKLDTRFDKLDIWDRDSNVTFLVENNSIVFNKTYDAALCIVSSGSWTNETIYELMWVKI